MRHKATLSHDISETPERKLCMTSLKKRSQITYRPLEILIPCLHLFSVHWSHQSHNHNRFEVTQPVSVLRAILLMVEFMYVSYRRKKRTWNWHTCFLNEDVESLHLFTLGTLNTAPMKNTTIKSKSISNTLACNGLKKERKRQRVWCRSGEYTMGEKEKWRQNKCLIRQK